MMKDECLMESGCAVHDWRYWRQQARDLDGDMDRLRTAMEQLRVQAAGCLGAAEGATWEPASPQDYGWSLAYQKTLELRLKYDVLKAQHQLAECVLAYERRQRDALATETPGAPVTRT